MKRLTIASLLFLTANLFGQQGVEGQLIFPLQEKHVHSSSIVELPNGDLLTCWFEGSGERTANDVVINGSRLKRGETKWSEPFLMADSPGQPDCNPMLFLNNNHKLFLVWIVVQANRWETSILKVKTTTDYQDEGVPKWEWQDVILLKPGVEFEKRVKEQFEKYGREDLAWAEYARPYEEMLVEAAKDRGKRETGWMTRTHPTILKNGQILLPLYSDGYNFGLIAISEDDGETWKCSLPIVGRGVNQPSLVVRNDGSIDAYMRDDGDEPGRILISHSDDQGTSWSYAQKSDIPNPGASIEVIKLKSGHWLLVYNDIDDGRYSLAAAISDDEGKSWKWKRKLENLKGGSFSYPSVIQGKDGRIHITYSYHPSGEKKSIKHRAIEEAWIMDYSNKEAGKEITLRLEPGPGNPRNSEGDFIQLKDGRILFIYTHFTEGAGDHAGAHLAGRYSNDGGKTWTEEDVIILPNEGGMNVMSVSLLRLNSGEVALFYLRKNSESDCIPFMRISTDEAKTWSEPIRCMDAEGYYVVNNDRVVQLQNGRIIYPAALHRTVETKFEAAGRIICYYSDDNGKHWIKSGQVANPDNIVLQEPGIVELKNGTIMLFCRTDAGLQYFSFSEDQGKTWSPIEAGNIKSPLSPASIERIPSTGDLLLVWNNNYEPERNGGNRTPYNLAISKDEGNSWQKIKTVENDPDGWYCYTAIEFVGNHLLLGHCAGDRKSNNGLATTQITCLSMEWIYQEATGKK
ncbi:MAG: exo-alpha-sialidase [Bacteroidota bacterium]